MNVRKILFLIFAFAVIAAAPAAVRPFGQTVEILDIPLLYEIDGHPDYGFFSEIHSISMDENKQVLHVLHDTPAALSTFGVQDGLALDSIKFQSRVEAPARTEICQGRTWVLHNRRLFLLEDDNSLSPPALMKDANFMLEADFARCTQAGDLLLADSKKKEFFLVPAGGTLHRIDASAIDGRKHLAPKQLFASMAGAAFGPLNRIFILDNRAGVIRAIDNSGRLLSSILLSSPSGSHTPWEVSSIAMDSSGLLWAVNTSENALDVYDSFGSLLYRVRNIAEDGTEFRFIRPVEVLIDGEDRLFLVDNGSFKIKVFDISGIQ